MARPARVRFAPSPSGHLHVGNARTALFNWLFARGRAGAFILRIEDTDAERSTASSESSILEDLRWLGLDWDEGPDRGGPHGPYRQSERRALHAGAAASLLASGAAYRCFCTTGELEREREAQRGAGTPPRYGGRCKALARDESEARAAREPWTLRFDARADHVRFRDLIHGDVEFPGSQLGDPVIMRADGSPTYNFAVVVDDLAMGITHVIRGEDHLSNTPRQVLLYGALGGAPPEFAHLPMVLGNDGAPLSKRHGAASVSDFRRQGILPEALLNYLALLGWAHPEGREILSAAELAARFGLDRVGKAAAAFDHRKLTWLNAHYLRGAGAGRLARECAPALREAGRLDPWPGTQEAESWLGRALELFAGQMETLEDAPRALRALLQFERALEEDPGAGRALEELSLDADSAAVVASFARRAAARRPPLLLTREAFRETARDVGRETGARGRALFHPIRLALSLADSGPELDRLVPLIDEATRLDPAPSVPSCALRAGLVMDRLPGGGAGRRPT